MNRDVMEKWVSALRSGTYEQGVGCLRYTGDDGRPAYCVLGVLCQIHADETRSAAWLHEYTSGSMAYGRRGWRAGDWDVAMNSLPQCVMDWSGMHTPGGRLPNDSYLAVLNDDGTEFAALADVIETHWESL